MRLNDLAPWKAANVIKANPDSPQGHVRRLALFDGKTVCMAVPKPKGIYWDELDEEKIERIPVLRKLARSS
jgi:5-formyltetrahydrofolate cyclo-ligase